MKEELEQLKQRCELIKQEQKMRQGRIEKLLETEEVKEYLTLIEEEKEEDKKINALLEQMKIERMCGCSHIFVISEVIRENNGKRVNKTGIEYCIKCDLTNKYHLNKMPKQFLTLSKTKMWSIYQETSRNSRRIKKVCEIGLAKEIYDNLKEEMKDVDDDMLVSLLEEQILKHQQESIAKRLNLKK